MDTTLSALANGAHKFAWVAWTIGLVSYLWYEKRRSDDADNEVENGRDAGGSGAHSHTRTGTHSAHNTTSAHSHAETASSAHHHNSSSAGSVAAAKSKVAKRSRQKVRRFFDDEDDEELPESDIMDRSQNAKKQARKKYHTDNEVEDKANVRVSDFLERRATQQQSPDDYNYFILQSLLVKEEEEDNDKQSEV